MHLQRNSPVVGWKKSLKDEIISINNFERQLSDSGVIIIKFFLHISKDEQKMRLLERERNPLTAWLVTPRIWDFHHHYDTYLPIIDEFIENTDTDYAPWHIIEATDRKYAILKVYSYLVKTLEKRTAATSKNNPEKKNRKAFQFLRKILSREDLLPFSSHSKEECQKTA